MTKLIILVNTIVFMTKFIIFDVTKNRNRVCGLPDFHHPDKSFVGFGSLQIVGVISQVPVKTLKLSRWDSNPQPAPSLVLFYSVELRDCET